MSYYKKITDWVLTHHATRRIRERIDTSHLEEYQLYPYIEDLIKYAVVETRFPNGDTKLVNHHDGITFIINKNVIKTVINHKNKWNNK